MQAEPCRDQSCSHAAQIGARPGGSHMVTQLTAPPANRCTLRILTGTFFNVSQELCMPYIPAPKGTEGAFMTMRSASMLTAWTPIARRATRNRRCTLRSKGHSRVPGVSQASALTLAILTALPGPQGSSRSAAAMRMSRPGERSRTASATHRAM